MRRRRIRAVVFDLDGVLVDSEPLYLQALNQVLAEEGAYLSPEENQSIVGSTVEDTWQFLKQRFGLPKPIEHYYERYDQAVLGALSQGLALQPGASRLLQAVRDRGLKKALASSSLGKWVEATLRGLNLSHYFDVVIAGEDVERGKPYPDIYLLAAQRLGVGPEECLAIEDSPPGVAAARAAGLFTVAVRTEYTRDLNLDQADLVLNSLEDFDLSFWDEFALAEPGGKGKRMR